MNYEEEQISKYKTQIRHLENIKFMFNHMQNNPNIYAGRSQNVKKQVDLVTVNDQADFVTLSVYATVTDIISIDKKPQVLGLDRFHIWMPEYVENRLSWKPTHPLQLLLLRCHRLISPISVPVMPDYGGCKSWVELIDEYPLGESRQVIPENQFQRKVAEIKTTLTEP